MGLVRSGRAAAAAVAARGSDVVGYDANSDLDVSGIDGEMLLGEWSDALLFGVELVVTNTNAGSGGNQGLRVRRLMIAGGDRQRHHDRR